MNPFEERLAQFLKMNFESRPPQLGESLVVDMRAVRVVSYDGHPGGLMSALFAAQFVTCVESARLLAALHDAVSHLLNANGQDEIIPRLTELHHAAVIVGKHLDEREAAIMEASEEMSKMGDAPAQPVKVVH